MYWQYLKPRCNSNSGCKVCSFLMFVDVLCVSITRGSRWVIWSGFELEAKERSQHLVERRETCWQTVYFLLTERSVWSLFVSPDVRSERSQGVFKPGLFSLVASGSSWFSSLVWFVWADLNTTVGPKQTRRDPLEEVVLVWSQMNSGAVCLWWERDPTSIRPKLQGFSAGLSYSSSVASRAWHAGMLLAASRRITGGLIWISFLIIGQIRASSGPSSCVYVLAPAPIHLTNERREHPCLTFTDVFWFTEPTDTNWLSPGLKTPWDRCINGWINRCDVAPPVCLRGRWWYRN